MVAPVAAALFFAAWVGLAGDRPRDCAIWCRVGGGGGGVMGLLGGLACALLALLPVISLGRGDDSSWLDSCDCCADVTNAARFDAVDALPCAAGGASMLFDVSACGTGCVPPVNLCLTVDTWAV